MIGHMCVLVETTRGARSADARRFRTWSEFRVAASLVYGGGEGNRRPRQLAGYRRSSPVGVGLPPRASATTGQEIELIDRRPCTTSLNSSHRRRYVIQSSS